MYKHPYFLTSIALAMFFLTGCDKPEAPVAPTAESAKKASEQLSPEGKGSMRLTADEIQQSGVVVTTIQSEQVNDQLVLTANISANQDRIARVTPRVEGQLVKVMVNLGDDVKAGQSLALVESVQVAEARTEYRRSQSELKLSEANFQRSDRLFQQEVIPQRQWLEAKSAMERAEASARGSAEHLRMLGGISNSGTSSFIVTAPFSGTVIEKDAVLGEQAKSDSNLFTIADLSTVWIEADVSEKDLGKLGIGAPATVTVSSFANEPFQGKVSYISRLFDKQTRTVKARIALPNPDGKLRIDMFARVVIDLARGREALVLPLETVLLVQGQSTVYVQTGNGFEARAVEVSEQTSKGVVITSGLKAGEQVVTAGAYALKSRQLKSQIGDE